MKKLMFAVAALAAGATFAIESANVVGYAQAPLKSGFTGTGLNFVNVDNTARCLNDLKVVGYEEASVDEVFLQKLDDSGYTLDDNIWAWLDLEDPDEGTFYGWYSDLGEGSDEPLALGEGVWVQAPSSAFAIQVAGQVYGSATSIQLQSGFTMCANPAPKALTLNDAVVAGYEEASVDEVFLQKLDDSGYTLNDNIWSWLDLEDPDEGTFYGWYSDLGEGSDEPLALGEAVWVQAPSNAFTLDFPSAL